MKKTPWLKKSGNIQAAAVHENMVLGRPNASKCVVRSGTKTPSGDIQGWTGATLKGCNVMCTSRFFTFTIYSTFVWFVSVWTFLNFIIVEVLRWLAGSLLAFYANSSCDMAGVELGSVVVLNHLLWHQLKMPRSKVAWWKIGEQISDSTQHVRSSGDMPRSPIKLLDRIGKKTEIGLGLKWNPD